MIAIVFTPEIQKKIHEIVYASEVETGVTLFGKKEGAVFSVTDACGPNPLATHEACHYSGDDYASFEGTRSGRLGEIRNKNLWQKPNVQAGRCEVGLSLNIKLALR